MGRSVSEGMTAAVAKKYAAGGITDGTEVSWGKKKEIPAELASALGQSGISSTAAGALSGNPISPRTPHGEKMIDLLQNKKNNETSSGDAKNIGDGVTVSWSKNKNPLTGDAKAEQLQRAETKPKLGKGKKSQSRKLLSVLSGK